MNPEWIMKNGKRILFIDYSACATLEEGFAVVDRAMGIYKSATCKLDVLVNAASKLSSNPDMTKRVNELGAYSKSIGKVNRKAAYGIDGLKMVFFRAYQMYTKDETKLFKTKEEALEWLTA